MVLLHWRHIWAAIYIVIIPVFQGEWIDLFFNQLRQLPTQLHPGYSSLPSHMAQDICLCYFPRLRKLMRSSDKHSSQIWRGSANTGVTVGLLFYYIVGTCFVKHLISFRVAIPGTVTQNTLFVWTEHTICFSVSNAGSCCLKRMCF